ncbi:beta-galactosidase family protein [Mucilaginibacter sp. UR6-11]|uniref:glycoside hydrolase family 35 protein n=1 Tax=Mucilaginibacter sp. UR6-11 TaxID=1435644 RepID=UPI001E3FFFBB|nr:beta-galactosidase family protein [Mucilaginibacter sp. UR6-11]MCC8426179.1 beta-galactosidase [Mucilaginibacter sp. UR6-11]
MLAFLLLLSASATKLQAQAVKHTFTLSDNAFLLDGKPFQIISGEMHYTRIPRGAWRQRMRMAKAMGLNTIGTYVFWNANEPQKGHYDFTGNNDIAEFVKIAREEGLWVILRPSPYVCAEWEFGGYPYWLEKEEGLQVRSTESKYLEAYHKYIMQIGKQLAPLQINHGGNILMVQIENEYGSYGADKKYLALNQKMFIEAGFDGQLYTCDPEDAIKNGHLPGLLPAINGVDDVARVKRLINENHDGKGPYYIAEWYPAWFDWWGEKHHTVPAEQYLTRLDKVLAAGISINMYMFHGGTTRGFMNGANYNDKEAYAPQVSSYDYDAPLDEAGNATDKFMKFRAVIEKYLPAGVALPEVPSAKPSMDIPAIHFTQTFGLFDQLPVVRLHTNPQTFEDLNQAYGFVLYRTTVAGGKTGTLKIDGLRDYGIIYINGKRTGILDRRLKQDSMQVTLPNGKVRIDILVENLGRINFGPYLLKNKKGITGKVLFDNTAVKNWYSYGLPLTNLNLHGKGIETGAGKPVIKKGGFDIKKPADTYLDLSNWGKGTVWINGHNLGRYWNIGPQQTIYVPAEWLKTGANDIEILELIKTEQNTISGLKTPVLNKLNPQ